MDDQTRELMFSSVFPDYETPDKLFKKYKDKYGIEIDVCATADNTKCAEFISPEMDIFKTAWDKPAWMNPPYNKPEKPCKSKCEKKKCEKRGSCVKEYIPGQIDFVERAVGMTFNATTTVCLLPARTDTKIFHKYIWDKDKQRPYPWVKELDFLEGRLVFKGMDAPAPFPSMVVVFGF